MKIKQPQFRNQETRLSELIQHIIIQINKSANTELLKGFKDELDGVSDIERFKAKVRTRFNEENIYKYVEKIFKSALRLNNAFWKTVAKEFSIDIRDIFDDEADNKFMREFALKTTGVILNTVNIATDRAIQETIAATATQETKTQLKENIKNKMPLYKSDLIGVNEIKNFNREFSDARALGLGIKKGVWNTVGDERTRPCHQDRDQKEFDLSVGLFSTCDNLTLQPAEDINCRCWTTYIME